MWLEFFCWWCWVISIYSIQTGPVIKQQVFYIDDSLMKRPRDFNVPYAFLFSFAVSAQTFVVFWSLFSCDFSLYASVCSVPAVISRFSLFKVFLNRSVKEVLISSNSFSSTSSLRASSTSASIRLNLIC